MTANLGSVKIWCCEMKNKLKQCRRRWKRGTGKRGTKFAGVEKAGQVCIEREMALLFTVRNNLYSVLATVTSFSFVSRVLAYRPFEKSFPSEKYVGVQNVPMPHTSPNPRSDLKYLLW